LHEKELCHGLAASQCYLQYDETVGLQAGRFTAAAKYDSARTRFEVEVRKILTFGRANEK